jgi:hypothetical protein
LVLDIFHVDSSARPDVREHVTVCASCQEYLGGYPTVHMPAAIAALRAPRRSRRWWWAALALPALASVAIVALPEEGVREKGLPSVAVYVKHEDNVALWDGQRVITTGDSLRLRVTSAGYRFVAVEDANGDVLYRSALQKELLLPVSFAVDASGEEETLIVVLTSNSPTKAVLQKARTVLLRDPDEWSTTFTLPKKSSQ